MKSADIFSFRLYVTGDAPNSVRALANLNALCRRFLPERHLIEVIDLLAEPERALTDEIIMTPTLIKLAPGVPQRIVGSLSDLPPLLASLGLSSS
jgi:circadian clock protein KaiB